MKRLTITPFIPISKLFLLPLALLSTLITGPLAWGESGFSLAPYPIASKPSPTLSVFKVSSAVQQAQKLWQYYQTYEAAYNPELAHLYANTATIQIQHQHVNNHEPVTEIIPTGQYQQSIRQLMPVAKAAGDCSLYENVRFVEKGPWVIVQATRVDGRGGYRVPHWMTILPDAANPLGGTVVAEVAVIQDPQ